MKTVLNKPIFAISDNNYLNWLIIIAPLLNFLTGLNIDLFSPSLPAIATYFHTNITQAEQTIAITMIGFGFGCITFGSLIDSVGRRPTVIFGLACYSIASLAAVFAHHINTILIIRFIQGFMVASVSIGVRTIIADSFTGKRFNVAITYTSITYGLGPVLGPFIGSILQTYCGWQANFLAFTVFAILLLLLLLTCVQESLPEKKPLQVKPILRNYKLVFQHFYFLSGIMIISIAVLEQVLYPTVGPFIIKNIYHQPTLTFGDTALLASLGYLTGTLTNRFLIHHSSIKHIISFGFGFFMVSNILQWLGAYYFPTHLTALVLPLFLIYYSFGFIFPNVLATCLSFFKNNIGPASAILTTSLTTIGGIGIAMISLFTIHHTYDLAAIFSVLLAIQLIIFFAFFRRSITN